MTRRPALQEHADASMRALLRRLLTPEGLADPYSIYAELRAREAAGAELGRVVVSHAQASEVLTSRLVTAERIDALAGQLDPAVRAETDLAIRTIKSLVVFRDPPAHTRVRRLLGQALRARAVTRQTSVIEQAANQLIDRIVEQGAADLRAALTYPLPAMVVAGILGIPPGDRRVFERWANDIVFFVGSGSLDAAIARRTQTSVTEMHAYMRGLVAARRARPADDLLTAMIEAADADGSGGGWLSDEEIHANALFLMTAGHDTATDLLNNAVLTLLRHPEQLRLLRERPELVERCVEEVLRFESPVQITARLAAADTTLAGRAVNRGDPLLVLLGAANRDPDVFDRAEEFLIERGSLRTADDRDPGGEASSTVRRHLAFGIGPHWCIGGSLAREEARIVLQLLLERLPNLRLDEPAEQIAWQPTLNFRGPLRLRVRWG